MLKKYMLDISWDTVRSNNQLYAFIRRSFSALFLFIRRSFSEGRSLSYFPVNSAQWTVPFSALFLRSVQSYFKNFKGLNVKLFPVGFAGTGSCEVEKYVNSVSIWIFSTFGAWYPLRFPASVFFSWVCMFYRFSLFVLIFSSEQCSVNSAVLRSLSPFSLFLFDYYFLLHHQLSSAHFHEVHSRLSVQVNRCFLVIEVNFFQETSTGIENTDVSFWLESFV